MAQSTSDYRKFKIMGGNRRVVKAHVKNIAESMALYPDIFKIKPILVNENLDVVDGQHRLAAAKMLKVPVWYEVVKNVGSNEAIIINNNQRNWSTLDYIRSYAQQGLSDYKEFLRIFNKHQGIPVYTVLRYTAGPTSNLASQVRDGKLKMLTADMGDVLLEELGELIEINPDFARTGASRMMFLVFQIKGYDHDRMIKKLNIATPSLIKLIGRAEDILRSLEDVYNFKQQIDIVRFY